MVLSFIIARWLSLGTTWRHHKHTSTQIVNQAPIMARHAATRHHNSVARRLGVGPCGQSLLSRRPCYPTTRIRSPPTSVVSSKPFPHSTGPVQSLPQTMGAGHQRPLWLWRDSDNVSHCRGLSSYKVRRRSTGAARSWRGRCQVAL